MFRIDAGTGGCPPEVGRWRDETRPSPPGPRAPVVVCLSPRTPLMTRLPRHTRIAAALATFVALAACSESSTAPVSADESATSGLSATGVVTNADAAPTALRPSASLTATTTTTTTTTTTNSVVGCTGTTIVLTADEKRTLDLHNQKRAASGLPQFCVHPALTAAARAHSQDMLAKGYFSHTSLDGRTFVTRVVNAGYTGWRALAENIAWGSGYYGAPDYIFNSWMNSAGHKANILNGTLREIGIGVAAGTFKTYTGARMYTVDFGTR
jgi:uncharacterized protein YkwD